MALSLLMAGFMGAKVGGGIGSSIAQAGAIRDEAEFQSMRYDMNARIASFQAKEAVRFGEKAAQSELKSTKQTIGKQRAMMAASGVEVSSGSALDIQTSTSRQGALNAMTIRNNAWREAWGYKMDAASSVGQSKFASVSGKYNSRSTLISGGLNAVGDIASGYMMAKK